MTAPKQDWRLTARWYVKHFVGVDFGVFAHQPDTDEHILLLECSDRELLEQVVSDHNAVLAIQDPNAPVTGSLYQAFLDTPVELTVIDLPPDDDDPAEAP